MATLLEKVSTLISANMHYLVDQALKSNSMAVIDHYIRQLEDHLEDMEEAAATVGGEMRSITRKLNEQKEKAAKLDRAIDSLLIENNEAMAMSAQGKLNSTMQLITVYQGQEAHLQEEYQKLVGAKQKIEDRLSMIRVQREELQLLVDLAKSKENVVKAMRSLDDLKQAKDTDICRIAQGIYTRLDKASASMELQSSGIEVYVDQLLDRNAIGAQLAERKKKLPEKKSPVKNNDEA